MIRAAAHGYAQEFMVSVQICKRGLPYLLQSLLVAAEAPRHFAARAAPAEQGSRAAKSSQKLDYFFSTISSASLLYQASFLRTTTRSPARVPRRGAAARRQRLALRVARLCARAAAL